MIQMFFALIVLVAWPAFVEGSACKQFSQPGSRCYKTLQTSETFSKRLTQCGNGLLAIHSKKEIYDAALAATNKDFCQKPSVIARNPPAPELMYPTKIHLGMGRGEVGWVNGEKMDYNLTGLPSMIAGDCANMVYFQCDKECIDPSCDYWHFQASCDDDSVMLCSGKVPSKAPNILHLTKDDIFPSILFLFFFQIFLCVGTLGAGILLFLLTHTHQLKKYYRVISKLVQISSAIENLQLSDRILEKFLQPLSVTVTQLKIEQEEQNQQLMDAFPGSPLAGLSLDQTVPWKLNDNDRFQVVEATAREQQSVNADGSSEMLIPRLPSPEPLKQNSSGSLNLSHKKTKKQTTPSPGGVRRKNSGNSKVKSIPRNSRSGITNDGGKGASKTISVNKSDSKVKPSTEQTTSTFTQGCSKEKK